MRHFSADTLEEVFLKLCQYEEYGTLNQISKYAFGSHSSLSGQAKIQIDINRSPQKCQFRPTEITKLQVLIGKNFRRFRRNIL
jgi:hypothetical protein